MPTAFRLKDACSCEQFHIEPIEIPQKGFRDVAEEVGYVFKSETANAESFLPPDRLPLESHFRKVNTPADQQDLPRAPSKTEKAWYYRRGKNGRGYFLAFVNAKGSCSIRRFEADRGTFLGRENKSGEYQQSFSEYLVSAVALHLSRQPNLERDCKDRLPDSVLSELRSQVPDN